MTRERSIWGWGWADKFPSATDRRAFGEGVAAIMGLHPGEPVDPPEPSALSLPAPRAAVPEVLRAFASAAPLERARRSYGKSFIDVVRGLRGEYPSPPDFVLRPTSEAEVEMALDWATKARVALIPFGGGTSVVGGVDPDIGAGYNGAATIDLGALHRVLEVDPTSRAARIQAGALGPALNEQLSAHGLQLRHFPQSYEFSTLGGWIATRAGGHYATLYTHIDDLVESIRMLTPSGGWSSRRLPGSGAGPSPDRFVLGSEGSLGVITEAWMRVVPRPRFKISASVNFETFTMAADAAQQLAQSGLYPTNCRVLDEREALINGVATDGTAIVLVGFESSDHPLEPWMDRALEITSTAGGRCDEGPRSRDSQREAPSATDNWRASFLEGPYLRDKLVSLGMIADTFETACTWDVFPQLHRAIIRNVRDAMRATCGAGFISCRLTHVYPDGPAPYYTIVAPSRPGAQIDQWQQIKRAADDTLIQGGATITHHHAVGRMHRRAYDQQRPDPFATALRAAKAAVDPAGIMNPGAVLDP